MERVLIGVIRKDRVSNQDLRKKTEVQDIIQEIKSDRPRAYTRGRGRQSRRWMDGIKEYGSVTWKRTAQDRVKWKADMKRPSSCSAAK